MVMLSGLLVKTPTRARKDLDRAHDLLAEYALQAANRMVETILDRVTQLEQFPESGPVEPSLAHRKKELLYSKLQ